MYLFGIRLEQISFEEFQRMNRVWYGTGSGSTDKHDLLRVNYTITSSSYESLLLRFRENKFATKLSFFADKEWRQIKADDLTFYSIRAISEALRSAPKRPGNLELYFRPYSDHELITIEPRAVRMRFGELEGKIAGYEVSFPRSSWTAFEWKRIPNLEHENARGLWVPKDQNK